MIRLSTPYCVMEYYAGVVHVLLIGLQLYDFFSCNLKTCSLSSGWTKSAGVKGLGVIPVVWISVVGIETEYDHSSFGNDTTREMKIIAR